MYDIRSEYWNKTSSKVVRKASVGTSQPWLSSNAVKKCLQVLLWNTGQERTLQHRRRMATVILVNMRPLDRRGDASSRLYSDINLSIETILCKGTEARDYMSFFRWIFTNFGHPFAPKIPETAFSFNFLRDPCQGKCKRYRVSSTKTGSKCYRPHCFINNISACTETYLKRNFTISIVYRLFELFHRGIANDELPKIKKLTSIASKMLNCID